MISFEFCTLFSVLSLIFGLFLLSMFDNLIPFLTQAYLDSIGDGQSSQADLQYEIDEYVSKWKPFFIASGVVSLLSSFSFFSLSTTTFALSKRIEQYHISN
mmetsp:Transcript_45965/g.33718  ORF Transcript_45965/g.33718 Transcript_45965/m.33718 type:complete len:101 (+) Transcript_45965:128-430(+)